MKLESPTEESSEKLCGIDMNSPQLECTSAKPVTPEQEESSAVLGSTTTMEVSKDVGSAEESGSNTVKTSRQPLPLLDLNLKVKDSTPQLVQQSFNEAQQCQLRTQILVYGSLIEGTLPGEALMGVAFADISKVTRVESWEDYVKGSKSMWEKVWQTAAMRLQRSATIAGALHPSTNSSRSSVTATTSSQLVPNNESLVLRLPMSKNKNSREGNLKKNSSRGSKSAPPNNPVLPAGYFSPPSLPNCTTTGWNLSLSGKPVTQTIQGASNHADQWEARCGPFSYSQHTSCSTPAVSISWVAPFSTPECWVAPALATALPVIQGPSAHSETIVVSASVTGYTGSQYPSYVPAMPHKHPLASFLPAASGANLAAFDIVSLKDKAGTRKSEKRDPKTKRRKESESHKNAAISLAPSFAENPHSPSRRLRYAANTLPITAASMTQPVMATNLDMSAPLVKPTSNDPGTSIHVASSTDVRTIPVSHNLIISCEGATVGGLSSQSTTTLVEQAKLSAQEAVSSAELAIQQSQSIWSQITLSDFDTDHEALVASSATAVAAAASVAKAAAAAAKLAYEAAAQAAAMVNETVEHTSGVRADLESMRKEDSQSIEEVEREKDIGGKWQLSGSSTSIISVAKAKVKQQLISAAVATKRAQNLESAVQAAELAVEAAWQVGAVVAMGDPVPMTLKALKEAGMENCWKMGLAALEKEFGDVHGSLDKITSSNKPSEDHAQETSKRKYHKRNVLGVSNVAENCAKISVKTGKAVTKKKLLKRKRQGGEVIVDKKAPKLKKAKDVQAKEQMESSAAKVLGADVQPLYQKKQADLNYEADKIVEGSIVEVVPDEDGLQGVWFSAKVLSTNDDRVLVLYDELLADDGKSHLQEWIPLRPNGSLKHGPPRVRLAHPILKDEASRKKRRSALGNQLWVVGDHVDAWMRDGWWEGVVTSISEEDENKVTVFFPGDGDRQAIKSWNLRPSLVWKDGSWRSYNAGQKEAYPRVDRVMETNTTILPIEAEYRGRNSPTTKSRSTAPPNPDRIGREQEMPLTLGTSVRRKFLGIMRKPEKDGNLKSYAATLKKKMLKTSHAFAHVDIKARGRGKNAVRRTMAEDGRAERKDFSEDIATIPDNQTLKELKAAPNEKTLSPSSLSSNLSNPQLAEPQSLIPVLKSRKPYKKATKTVGGKVVPEANGFQEV